MPKVIHAIIVAAIIVVSCPKSSFAQEAPEISGKVRVMPKSIMTEAAVVPKLQNSKIERNIKPIAYWVDTKSLRVRDNPVAGNVIGTLDYGQKIMAYSRYENWVRISKNRHEAQWINSDFLSDSRLSWASYTRNTSTRSSDVIAVRIVDPTDIENRIYGVRLRTSATGNTLITTRKNTFGGVLYQNRFVSCKNQKVVGVRLIGIGSNFLNAQNVIQNAGLNISQPEHIEDKAKNNSDKAISTFACKAQSF